MPARLGSLVAGGLLVAVGFALAQVPGWLSAAEASVTPNTAPILTTFDDDHPDRLYTWAFDGQRLVGVTAHTVQPDGVVFTQDLRVVTVPRTR